MTAPIQPLAGFSDPTLTFDTLLPRLAWLRDVVGPRLDRYMGYYRNTATELTTYLSCSPSASLTVRPFRQFQEMGLPARITGFRTQPDGTPVPNGVVELQRKEVVIENDIAWRIGTLVDFAAARMPALVSTARDPALRQTITHTLNTLLDRAGGAGLLQELVLMGAIHGSAWLRICPTHGLLSRLGDLRAEPAITPGGLGGSADEAAPGDGETRGSSVAEAGTSGPDIASTESPVMAASNDSSDITRWLRLETVETTRICPLPPVAAAGVAAYQALLRELPGEAPRTMRSASLLERLGAWITRTPAATTPDDFSFDLFSPAHWQRYIRGTLSEEGPNLLGVLPLVRYENQRDPAAGTRFGPNGSAAVDTGFSEVEPLIGPQDELNTRLSDRAYRVTMTSFRMYLGKGIEGFTQRPVGPGQMWSTDNPDASIETFGGDAACPSEDAHIGEVRDALDKISGVTPVAAGLIRGKVGNLTSAVALRITLIALLARTARKQAALTEALEETCRRVLAILDRAGILPTEEAERGIDLNWPTSLPESDLDRLNEAQAKIALGIPRAVVLSELGYAETLNDER